MFSLSGVCFLRLLNPIMRMETRTEQLLLSLAVPSSHCLYGIQVHCRLYVPFDSFHWSLGTMHHPNLFSYDCKGTNK